MCIGSTTHDALTTVLRCLLLLFLFFFFFFFFHCNPRWVYGAFRDFFLADLSMLFLVSFHLITLPC
jgi:hypothetical protein